MSAWVVPVDEYRQLKPKKSLNPVVCLEKLGQSFFFIFILFFIGVLSYFTCHCTTYIVGSPVNVATETPQN